MIFQSFEKKSVFFTYFQNEKFFENFFHGILCTTKGHPNYVLTTFVCDELYGHNDCFSIFSSFWVTKIEKFISLQWLELSSGFLG